LNWLSGHAFQPSRLYQGNIFFPLTHAALYSDLSLGTAVLLMPLRVLVDDPVLLYNCGLLLALAFAGWAFSRLARERTGSDVAGLLAGTLAAFGSHQLSHIYHLNLLSTGWLALFLLGMGRLAETPTRGVAVLTAASFVLSAQSSGYYGVACLLLALVFAALRWRTLLQPAQLRATLAAVVLATLLMLPYLVGFSELRERDGLRRPPGMSRTMAFQPLRDLTSYGSLYRRVLGSGGERLFPGVLSLLLVGVALKRRRADAAFFAVGCGALLLVSLGPDLKLGDFSLPLPYRLLYALPPFDSMRHPYTFAAVATMLLAVLAGIGLAELVAPRPWLGPLALGLACLETLAPGPDLRDVASGLPPVYAKLQTLPPGPALEVPLAAPDVMLWAARHRLPVVNGDGAFLPSRHAQLNLLILREWIKAIPEDVDATEAARLVRDEFPVRYLIVPCGRQPTTCRLAGALNRSRLFRRIEEVEGGDRIYEVER
jgi:hypothetical protein